MNFEELMLRAVTNAETFKYTAKPNPVVGAILCNDNEIISEGYHEIYGSNHAEINAISNARKHQGKKFNNFSELALVCTLEPCSHVGKTGSCAEQIVETGIKKVVIGSIDPNPKVAGKGIEILKKNGIDVTVGIHEDIVKNQNKYFFFKHTNNRPYIILKIASSLDGKSHIESEERTIITSKASRYDVQILRASCDVILTGGNTLRNDNPRMNARVNFPTNQPKKILLTSKDCDKELNFFKDNNVQIYKNKDLAKIIKSFKDQDICSILIEAGPKLANSFLELGLVDEIISYTSNSELGDKAVSWFKENNAIESYGFKLESSYQIDSDIKEVFKKNG
jgi:diaminohydroxyphosphoribosylaminopyrimidine deaminase/5-amino-6-(5-phosphoribosylamino)uracil reductase